MPKTNRALNKARKLAWAGNYQEALPILEEEAAKGDQGAQVSLVYIYAYLLEWEKLMEPLVTVLQAHEDSFYAANVFDDGVVLVATIGQKTGKWKEISEFFKKRLAKIKYGARLKLVLKELYNYLDKKGKVAKKIFPVVEIEEYNRPPAEDAAYYREAVDTVFETKPKFKDPAKKNELESHLFALAEVYHQEEEMVKLYKPNNPLFNYEEGLSVARIYAKKGELKKAWAIIEDKITQWYPVDKVQLMPMELMIEDVFAPLMTKENCLKLLSAPKCGAKKL